MRYAYIGVEGLHDVATIGRALIEFHGASEINTIAGLKAHGVYEFWQPFTDLTFPHNDRRPNKKRPGHSDSPDEADFTKRMPVPAFYQFDDMSVAIHSADGDYGKMITSVEAKFQNWDYADELSAFALFCDADDEDPTERCAKVIESMHRLQRTATIFANVPNLAGAGHIAGEEQRLGIYIFPDNEHTGTLEDLLLTCIDITHQKLLHSAVTHMETGQSELETLKGRRMTDAKKNKAIIGCIANVFQPGASNQSSIQKDKWVCQETQHLEPIIRLNRFLSALLKIS